MVVVACIAGAATVSGCSLSKQIRTVTDYCTPWRAIYPSRQDVLTDGTAKAILAHDQTGEKLCGWKPTHAGGKR